MSSGLLAIESVTDNGGGSYTLTVEDSTGVVSNDHVGARLTSASGPGAVYLATSVPTGTSIVVSDTLTEENGGAFGPPIAAAGWYCTPSAQGLSLIPHQAKPYDAAERRNSFLLKGMGLQQANAVAITGGTIAGITDLAVADGGTGASTAADARTNLGLGTIATQAASAVAITGGTITGITDLAVADGGTGASTAADARTNLGLGTIATQDASAVAITGGTITGITDLAVADGGTGASDASGARTNLGLVIGTNVQAQDASLQQIADATFARGGMIYEGASGLTPLAAGSANTLLAMGADDPAWATLSAILDAVIGSSSGTMLFRGSMSWTARGLGSANQVLAVAFGEPTWATLSTLETVEPGLADGRLSVSSSDPIGEGTSATLYYLPYVGNAIALYSGSAWVRRTFSGPTLDVSALTADTVYDVFAYDNSGTVALEATAWSNSGAGTGARATALVYQDGVLVRSGATTRRYLGTIRTVDDSGVKARDAAQFRYVDNAQNRVPYRDSSHDSTDSWSSSGTNLTWAARNGGNAAWVHRWVHGLAQDVRADGVIGVSSAGADAYSGGPALNWTSGAPATTTFRSVSVGGSGSVPESYAGTPAIGYGYVQCVETSSGSGTAPTVRGDAGGSFWGSGMTVEGER